MDIGCWVRKNNTPTYKSHSRPPPRESRPAVLCSIEKPPPLVTLLSSTLLPGTFCLKIPVPRLPGHPASSRPPLALRVPSVADPLIRSQGSNDSYITQCVRAILCFGPCLPEDGLTECQQWAYADPISTSPCPPDLLFLFFLFSFHRCVRPIALPNCSAL